MQKFFNLFNRFVNYKFSLKGIYFSLSTWFVLLVIFLGYATKFQTNLVMINIIMAFYVYLMIILITNRILFSAVITILLAISFDYIRIIKWQFLMQDFSASDIFMVQLLVNHGLFRLIYEYATKEIYLILLLLFVNFVLIWNKSDAFLEKQTLGNKHYYGLRFLALGVALLLTIQLFDMSIDRKSYFYTIMDSIKQRTKYYPRKAYGPFADIILTLQDIYIEPKNGTVDENVILKRVNTKLNIPKISNAEMPDIVVILNESVFDPSKLDYDFAKKLNFAFFQDTKYTKYSGILNVNTFGGSSWISEYEINTGIPHKSFKGPSYMPFITLVPKTQNSIMSYLKTLGYQIEVVYPVDKNFSLALESYTKLGADKMSDIYEFGFKPKSWGMIPDTMISDMIIDALDRNPDKPKYIFAATMLNHGPHSGFYPDNIGCNHLMNDALCSKLNDFVSRLSMTSKDQSDLIQKLMKRKRKTIIVNFGDHLPSFEGYSTQLRFKSDIKNYFQTFYNINANFAMKDRTKYKSLDIAFIPGLILDIAQLNNNSFYRSNAFVRKICNGNILHCHGQDNKIDSFLESYKSLIVKQLEPV